MKFLRNSAVVDAELVDELVDHAQDERRIGPGPDRHPLVGHGRRRTAHRVDRHQPARRSGAPTAHGWRAWCRNARPSRTGTRSSGCSGCRWGRGCSRTRSGSCRGCRARCCRRKWRPTRSSTRASPDPSPRTRPARRAGDRCRSWCRGSSPGSSAMVSRSFSAISSRASSQLIGTHRGSTPTSLSGLVRRRGVVIRSGSVRPSKPASPLAQVRPWLWGFSGSPRILSTTSSSLTWARIPQRFMQIVQALRTHPSP